MVLLTFAMPVTDTFSALAGSWKWFGDQQLAPPSVPGEAVRLRAHADLVAHRQRLQINRQDLARAARGCEHEGFLVLRAQNTAAFWTACDALDVLEALAVEHVHGVVLRVGNEHTTSRRMHIAVVESTRRVRRQRQKRD